MCKVLSLLVQGSEFRSQHSYSRWVQQEVSNTALTGRVGDVGRSLLPSQPNREDKLSPVRESVIINLVHAYWACTLQYLVHASWACTLQHLVHAYWACTLQHLVHARQACTLQHLVHGSQTFTLHHLVHESQAYTLQHLVHAYILQRSYVLNSLQLLLRL